MLTIIEISRLADLPKDCLLREIGVDSADPQEGVMLRYYSPSLKMVRRFVVLEKELRDETITVDA